MCVCNSSTPEHDADDDDDGHDDDGDDDDVCDTSVPTRTASWPPEKRIRFIKSQMFEFH